MENHFEKRDKLIAERKEFKRTIDEYIEDLKCPDYTSLDRLFYFYKHYEKEADKYYDYLEKTLKDF